MDSSPGALARNGSHSFEDAHGEDLSGQFSTTWTIALAVLMALLIVATVVGNALVMLAFVVDSSLRTQNNYFLLNLAISDFLVGKVPHLVSASLHPEIMIRLKHFGLGGSLGWVPSSFNIQLRCKIYHPFRHHSELCNRFSTPLGYRVVC